MKKALLSFAFILAICSAANAQQRTVLNELFTGENCYPCSQIDPKYWSRLDSGSNPAKVIQLTYMQPIPTSGWFYMQTKAISDARASYYSIGWAPYIRSDGKLPDPGSVTPGHPVYYTQHDIDSEYAIPSHFNLSVTTVWNTTYDSVIATVTIACPTTAFTGTSMYLRAALSETMDFTVAPGTNAMKHFEHVVKAMYPDSTGTSIAASWLPGATSTVILTCAFPYTIADPANAKMVVWIQDDFNNLIEQAAQTDIAPVPNNAVITTTRPAMICHDTSSVPYSQNVTLKNAGSNTLNSAVIYYSLDGAPYTPFAWSGSLSAGSTASVTLPTFSISNSTSIYHTILDSVAMPNGSPAITSLNKVSYNLLIDEYMGQSMPWSTSFENSWDWNHIYTMQLNFYKNMSYRWHIYYKSSTPYLGHTGTFAASFDSWWYPHDTVNILALPGINTNHNAVLSFWVAYGQYDGTSNEKLEVVYSTDCGTTWTSLWSAAGSLLATVPYKTTEFTPSSPSDYKQKTVGLNSVPAGAIIGFRATAGGGNDVWIDDINVMAGNGVPQIDEASININVFPNPAHEEATVSVNLMDESNVQVQLTDGIGRTVIMLPHEKKNIGLHNIVLNTSGLPAGIYNVMIHTDGGTFTRRLSIVK